MQDLCRQMLQKLFSCQSYFPTKAKIFQVFQHFRRKLWCRHCPKCRMRSRTKLLFQSFFATIKYSSPFFVAYFFNILPLERKEGTNQRAHFSEFISWLSSWARVKEPFNYPDYPDHLVLIYSRLVTFKRSFTCYSETLVYQLATSIPEFVFLKSPSNGLCRPVFQSLVAKTPLTRLVKFMEKQYKTFYTDESFWEWKTHD